MPGPDQQKLPHQKRPCLNILAITCLASRSSFPMHRYRLHVPKIINRSPHFGRFNFLNPESKRSDLETQEPSPGPRSTTPLPITKEPVDNDGGVPTINA